MVQPRQRSPRALLPLLLAVLLLLGPSAALGAAQADADAQEAAWRQAQAQVRPVATAVPEVPVQEAVGSPVSAEAVQGRLAERAASRWLGGPEATSLVVRDVETGAVLADLGADRALHPASVTKLLTAAAVVTAFPADRTFATRVVSGPEPDTITLVAGGDMMLAPGAGDPQEVTGRAGLGDLAGQVATTLEGTGLGTADQPVRLRLDISYAAGPATPQGWTDFQLRQGYTGRIAMLGTVSDRAAIGDPAPSDPAQSAARTFREALLERGVEVAGDLDEPVRTADLSDAQPDPAEVLGQVESAPVGELLGLGLVESDNALLEQLARQAAVSQGGSTAPADVAGWVVGTVQEEYGLDTSQVRLADVSGLSEGSLVPASTVGELLVAAAGGEHPQLQAVLGDLPIAGYTGTLWDRFHLAVHEPAVGVARAKTGSLPGITSLAGYVVTRDGRLLAYVVLAEGIGPDGAVLEARSVLDAMIASLAACGCGQ